MTALCAGEGMNPDWWFAADPADLRKAAGICQACPRREQCLNDGVTGSEWGVWGGLWLTAGKPLPIPEPPPVRRCARHHRCTCSTQPPPDAFRDHADWLAMAALDLLGTGDNRAIAAARRAILLGGVPAKPVLEHIAELRHGGMNLPQIAAATGVPVTWLRGVRKSSVWLDGDNAARVLGLPVRRVGRRDCTCPSARHRHGTYSAYKKDGCRCAECRGAQAARRRAQIAARTPLPRELRESA